MNTWGCALRPAEFATTRTAGTTATTDGINGWPANFKDIVGTTLRHQVGHFQAFHPMLKATTCGRFLDSQEEAMQGEADALLEQAATLKPVN